MIDNDSGADQRKHQSSASLAFVRGILRWQVTSPHKGPVTRKMASSWLGYCSRWVHKHIIKMQEHVRRMSFVIEIAVKYLDKSPCSCQSRCCCELFSPWWRYMRQWTGSVLLKVMACRLLGAKPLPQPMLTHCQSDPLKQTSVKFESKYKTFDWWKCIWTYHLWNGDHFVQGRWQNITRGCWKIVIVRIFSAFQEGCNGKGSFQYYFSFKRIMFEIISSIQSAKHVWQAVDIAQSMDYGCCWKFEGQLLRLWWITCLT